MGTVELEQAYENETNYWSSQLRNANLDTLERVYDLYLNDQESKRLNEIILLDIKYPLSEAFESRCDQLAVELPKEIILTSKIDYLRNKE